MSNLFWSDIGALICVDMQVELNMPLILFGFDQNVPTGGVFDLIVLMAMKERCLRQCEYIYNGVPSILQPTDTESTSL